MQTEKLPRLIRTRVDRRLVKNGLNEIFMGLLLVTSNGLTAIHSQGVRAFENSWLLGCALAVGLLAFTGIPVLRRRYVDPRVGFARQRPPTPLEWLGVAGFALGYVVLLRLGVSGPLIASIFPLAFAYMGHHYAAPRMYVAAGAVAIAMAIFTTFAMSPTAWLSSVATFAGFTLVCTGTFAFFRFVRTTPELDPASQC